MGGMSGDRVRSFHAAAGVVCSIWDESSALGCLPNRLEELVAGCGCSGLSRSGRCRAGCSWLKHTMFYSESDRLFPISSSLSDAFPTLDRNTGLIHAVRLASRRMSQAYELWPRLSSETLVLLLEEQGHLVVCRMQ